MNSAVCQKYPCSSFSDLKLKHTWVVQQDKDLKHNRKWMAKITTAKINGHLRWTSQSKKKYTYIITEELFILYSQVGSIEVAHSYWSTNQFEKPGKWKQLLLWDTIQQDKTVRGVVCLSFSKASFIYTRTSFIIDNPLDMQ